MPGNLSFNDLKKAVAAGTIDTVIVAMVDMQGRLIGKRFQAEFFLDGAHAEDGTAATICSPMNIDMEPVPGYAAASWDKGYGDFRHAARHDDLAALAVARRHRAGARRRARSSSPRYPAFAARGCSNAKSRAEAAENARLSAPRSSSSICSTKATKTIHNKHTSSRRPPAITSRIIHILQTTKEEGVMRAIRRGCRAPAFRSRTPRRVGPGAGGDSTSAIRTRSTWRTSANPEERVKEIAHGQGKAVTFMSKWNYGLGDPRRRPHVVWDAAGRRRCSSTPRRSFTMSPLSVRSWRTLAFARDMTYFLAPYINSYKRFQVGTFAPNQGRMEPRQPHRRFRLCGRAEKASASNARIGAPTSIPIWLSPP